MIKEEDWKKMRDAQILSSCECRLFCFIYIHMYDHLNTGMKWAEDLDKLWSFGFPS